jgi:outer membrane protein assembly factor BamD
MILSRRLIGVLIIISLLIGGCLWKKKGWGGKGETAAELYKRGLSSYKRKQYSRAIEIFNELKASFPGEDPYYTWAELKVADSYFHKEEYEEAINQYEEFKKFHPFHEDIPYVTFQIGLCYFNQMKSVDRDQTATRKALSNFEFVIANYSPSVFSEKAREKVRICKEKLAEKELYIAKYYYKRKKYEGAKSRLQTMVEVYPEVEILDEALAYLGRSYRKLGEIDAARKVFTELVRNFPDSKYSGEARRNLNELMEE